MIQQSAKSITVYYQRLRAHWLAPSVSCCVLLDLIGESGSVSRTWLAVDVGFLSSTKSQLIHVFICSRKVHHLLFKARVTIWYTFRWPEIDGKFSCVYICGHENFSDHLKHLFKVSHNVRGGFIIFHVQRNLGSCQECMKTIWRHEFVATEKQSPESIAQLNCFASLSQLKVTFSATTSSCFREKALKNLLHTMCSKYSDMFIEKLIPDQLNSCENSATVWYNPDEAHLLLPFFPLSM